MKTLKFLFQLAVVCVVAAFSPITVYLLWLLLWLDDPE